MLCIVHSLYQMLGNQEFETDERTPEMRVEKIFSMMDLVLFVNAGLGMLMKDGDGVLSKSEFIEGARDDPSMVEALNLYAGLM